MSLWEVIMATVSLRIDSNLALQAEREARIENRSKTKQLEFWAKLGKAISSKLSSADVFAVTQGIKTIKLEIAESTPIDSDLVFKDLENARTKGLLGKDITSARIYYEASLSSPGLLDRVDSTTGKRQVGQFKNGEFKAI